MELKPYLIRTFCSHSRKRPTALLKLAVCGTFLLEPLSCSMIEVNSDYTSNDDLPSSLTAKSYDLSSRVTSNVKLMDYSSGHPRDKHRLQDQIRSPYQVILKTVQKLQRNQKKALAWKIEPNPNTTNRLHNSVLLTIPKSPPVQIMAKPEDVIMKVTHSMVKECVPKLREMTRNGVRCSTHEKPRSASLMHATSKGGLQLMLQLDKHITKVTQEYKKKRSFFPFSKVHLVKLLYGNPDNLKLQIISPDCELLFDEYVLPQALAQRSWYDDQESADVPSRAFSSLITQSVASPFENKQKIHQVKAGSVKNTCPSNWKCNSSRRRIDQYNNHNVSLSERKNSRQFNAQTIRAGSRTVTRTGGVRGLANGSKKQCSKRHVYKSETELYPDEYRSPLCRRSNRWKGHEMRPASFLTYQNVS